MKLNLYQKTALSTIAATLFLIMVGGIVRAAGAGLGCPDWPKCYGLWIPPMHVSDLPSGFDVDSFNAFKTWTELVWGKALGRVGHRFGSESAAQCRYGGIRPQKPRRGGRCWMESDEQRKQCKHGSFLCDFLSPLLVTGGQALPF